MNQMKGHKSERQRLAAKQGRKIASSGISAG